MGFIFNKKKMFNELINICIKTVELVASNTIVHKCSVVSCPKEKGEFCSVCCTEQPLIFDDDDCEIK